MSRMCICKSILRHLKDVMAPVKRTAMVVKFGQPTQAVTDWTVNLPSTLKQASI